MDPFKRKSDGDHGNIMKSLWDKFLDIKEIIVILILLTGLTSDINDNIIYIIAIIILTISVIYKSRKQIIYKILAMYYFNNFGHRVISFEMFIYDDTIKKMCCQHDIDMNKYIKNYNRFIEELNEYRGIGIFKINSIVFNNLIYGFTTIIECFGHQYIDESVEHIVKNELFGYRSEYNRFKKKYMIFIESYVKFNDDIKHKIDGTFSHSVESLQIKNIYPKR